MNRGLYLNNYFLDELIPAVLREVLPIAMTPCPKVYHELSLSCMVIVDRVGDELVYGKERNDIAFS